MNKITKALIALTLVVGSLYGVTLHANTATKVIKLETGPKDDLYVSDAAFYQAKGERAIVFVPGFIFNKESWLFLAKSFQKTGIASISVNGKSPSVIKAAVKFLRDKGYTDISLIGASLGAAAVQDSLAEGINGVSKVVLLSPVKGAAISNESIDKLFIASKEEKAFPVVKKLFDGASHPKSIKTFSGSSHAQFIFYSKYRQDLIGLINGFIIN